jgi:hypothetical protein
MCGHLRPRSPAVGTGDTDTKQGGTKKASQALRHLSSYRSHRARVKIRAAYVKANAGLKKRKRR